MEVQIDVDALRQAVKDECCAAFFGGGIGPALLETFDADRASPQELVDMARRWGIDPLDYRTD